MTKFYVLSTFDHYTNIEKRGLVAAAVLDDEFIIQLAIAQLDHENMTLASYRSSLDDARSLDDLELAIDFLSRRMSVFLLYTEKEEENFFTQASVFGLENEAKEIARVPLNNALP